MELICEKEFDSCHLPTVEVGELYEFKITDDYMYKFVDKNKEIWLIRKRMMLDHFSFVK